MKNTMYYIDVNEDGKVRAGFSYDAPEVGPPIPRLENQTLGTLVQVDEPVNWAGPTETSTLYWKDGVYQWIETAELAAQRERKAADMSKACNEAILAGFTSSALGAVYSYPSKMEDQANLTGSVVRSMYASNAPDWVTPFWCADATGDWQYRPHTVAQIQHVGDDAVAARLACMAINEKLAKQIMAADADELKTIAWPA